MGVREGEGEPLADPPPGPLPAATALESQLLVPVTLAVLELCGITKRMKQVCVCECVCVYVCVRVFVCVCVWGGEGGGGECVSV